MCNCGLMVSTFPEGRDRFSGVIENTFVKWRWNWSFSKCIWHTRMLSEFGGRSYLLILLNQVLRILWSDVRRKWRKSFLLYFSYLNDCNNQQQRSKPYYEKLSKFISAETNFYGHSNWILIFNYSHLYLSLQFFIGWFVLIFFLWRKC